MLSGSHSLPNGVRCHCLLVLSASVETSEVSLLFCYHLWRDVLFLDKSAGKLPSSLRSPVWFMRKGLQCFLLFVWPRVAAARAPHSMMQRWKITLTASSLPPLLLHSVTYGYGRFLQQFTYFINGGMYYFGSLPLYCFLVF